MKLHRKPVSRAHRAGFNMIELLVTISIIGVVMTIGAPSLKTTIDDMRLSTTANNLLTFFNYARSESAKRGARVTLCISDSNLALCDTGATNWARGAIAFLDSNANGQWDAGEDILRVLDPLAAEYTIQPLAAFATGYYFYYRPSGAASSAGTLRVCRTGRTARDVSVNSVGRPMSQPSVTCP